MAFRANRAPACWPDLHWYEAEPQPAPAKHCNPVIATENLLGRKSLVRMKSLHLLGLIALAGATLNGQSYWSTTPPDCTGVGGPIDVLNSSGQTVRLFLLCERDVHLVRGGRSVEHRDPGECAGVRRRWCRLQVLRHQWRQTKIWIPPSPMFRQPRPAMRCSLASTLIRAPNWT